MPVGVGDKLGGSADRAPAVLLAELAATSHRVSQTSSRNGKIAALAEAIERLSPREAELGVLFLSGQIRQRKLGVGPATLMEISPGVAATRASLQLEDVDAALGRIAGAAGPGSTAERKRLLAALLAHATRAEQAFLRRLLFGELRQGALEGLVLEAIARACGLPLAAIRRAAMVAGGPAPVAAAALRQGAAGLDGFRVQLFQPVLPMLAQPAEDIGDAMTQLGEAALEWKLDGARVQAHKAGEKVRVYTRNLNDVTAAVPELVAAVAAFPSEALILDGEALALRSDGTPQPFQVTMRRFGRKLDIDAARAALPLSVFFFDCLRRDDDDLTGRCARERLSALSETLPADLIVPRLVTANPDEAEAFFRAALSRGHEGIMAKSLTATYDAGGRGAAWLKVKQAHPLDLVVLAAEWGHGRRKGWLSNLHLGARDAATGAFVMLGKTFKGLTDEMLEWQTAKLLALEVARDAYTVYVRPELVVEIAVNEIQESPRYPAGMALRFARVKRYRTDKPAAQADTIETVRALFERRAQPL